MTGGGETSVPNRTAAEVRSDSGCIVGVIFSGCFVKSDVVRKSDGLSFLNNGVQVLDCCQTSVKVETRGFFCFPS